jgi:hypothetical protein
MTSVFPIAYFGNIDYFRKLIAAQNVCIETKEHFIKQTVRTRCEILSANGKLVLSIPVERKNGSKTAMADVTIANQTEWRKMHWKAIESAYSSSPYFDFYSSEIYELIHQTEPNLIKFALTIQNRILHWLDIEKAFTLSTEYVKPLGNVDYRNDAFDDFSGINSYIQVFSPSNAFEANLSILDVIFCEGPLARRWIIN